MSAESVDRPRREAEELAALGAGRLTPEEEALLRRVRSAADRGRWPSPRDGEALELLRRRYARELAELRSSDAE